MIKPDKRWRYALPILVTEAATPVSIAVIRSLGRAGYPVHACAESIVALGCKSRFTSYASAYPAYNDAGFIPWLRSYVAEHNVRCLIPTEGLLLAIRPAFSEFSALLPLSGDESTVYAGMSKFDLFETLLDSHERDSHSDTHLPPCLLVSRRDAIPDEQTLHELGLPLFVKVDGVHSHSGQVSATHQVDDAATARSLITQLLDQFSKLIVQGYFPGKGVGAFLLVWKGRVLADFMHERIHEVRMVGSSYRKSAWHDELMRDAEAKLKVLAWEGVAMMEYRLDLATNRFALIEMNGRFWGSLHLALYANVDFPRLLIDAFFGHIAKPARGRTRDIACRNIIPLEAQYVGARLRDLNLGRAAKLASVFEFFTLTINPRVKSDLFFPGDRKLFWISLRDYLLTAPKKLASRSKRKLEIHLP